VEILIAYLPVLACAGAMVVCLRMMGQHRQSTDNGAERELSELRRRVAELERERSAISTEERTHG
jgi:hypothetical protein